MFIMCSMVMPDARWDWNYIAMRLPWICNDIAVSLPWDGHRIAMRLPWGCFQIALRLSWDQNENDNFLIISVTINLPFSELIPSESKITESRPRI